MKLDTAKLRALIEQNKTAEAIAEVERLFAAHAGSKTNGGSLVTAALVGASIRGALVRARREQLSEAGAILDKIKTLEAALDREEKINQVQNKITEL